MLVFSLWPWTMLSSPIQILSITNLPAPRVLAFPKGYKHKCAFSFHHSHFHSCFVFSCRIHELENKSFGLFLVCASSQFRKRFRTLFKPVRSPSFRSKVSSLVPLSVILLHSNFPLSKHKSVHSLTDARIAVLTKRPIYKQKEGLALRRNIDFASCRL